MFFSRISLESKLGVEYEPYIFAALNSTRVMIVVGTDYDNFNAVWVKNEWSRYLALITSGQKKTLIPCFKNKETVVVNRGGTAVAPLLKRAFMFLEDREWEEADKYCEKVLDQDPENAQAYLGKLMAELQVMNRKELVDCAEPFDDRDNYNKVLRFGDEALEKEMRGYITHINERKAEERRIAAQKAAEKRKRILSIAIPAIIADFAIILVVTKIIIPGAEQRSEYNAAVELINSGKYQDAIVAFEEMNGYKDSAKKTDECEYKIADSLY